MNVDNFNKTGLFDEFPSIWTKDISQKKKKNTPPFLIYYDGKTEDESTQDSDLTNQSIAMISDHIAIFQISPHIRNSHEL